MAEITLYHNSRCSKSRAALALLEENGVQPVINYYMEQPPSITELKDLLSKLGIELNELLRSNEADYEELGLGDESLSREIVLDLVCKHPQLIQRPIIVCGERAIIARPPELLLEFLNLKDAG